MEAVAGRTGAGWSSGRCRACAMTLVERVGEWPRQWFQEGREQGRREGLEHERGLLGRLAALRFGAQTAACLSGVLARITDPEGLAEVGELRFCFGVVP